MITTTFSPLMAQPPWSPPTRQSGGSPAHREGSSTCKKWKCLSKNFVLCFPGLRWDNGIFVSGSWPQPKAVWDPNFLVKTCKPKLGGTYFCPARLGHHILYLKGWLQSYIYNTKNTSVNMPNWQIYLRKLALDWMWAQVFSMCANTIQTSWPLTRPAKIDFWKSI